MTRFVIATVTHWNGVAIRGLVTGGDESGIFVQRADEAQRPIFCAFVNVKSIEFEV